MNLYFNYGAVDFFLEQSGELVLIEVNENPHSFYFIEEKNKIAEKLCMKKNIINCNEYHKKTFVNTIKNLSSVQNTKLGIIYKDNSSSLLDEIKYIQKCMCEYKIQVEYEEIKNCVIAEDNSLSFKSGFKPDIVFRRNFTYPQDIKQPIINDLRVREITNNKFITYCLLKKKIEQSKLKIKQPLTFLVTSNRDIDNALEHFHDENKEFIGKPNSGFGGKGFLTFNSFNFQKNIEKLRCKVLLGEQYLLQEKIQPCSFLSSDKKLYNFDIRVLVYGGTFAAIEARRCKAPINSRDNASDTSKIVTNIKEGAKDMIVVSRKNNKYDYTSETITCASHRCLDFSIDGNFLVLDNSKINFIKEQAEKIVRFVEKEIKQ